MKLSLARYLVDHGLVAPAEMDDALQRQVLFGGSLDTNLLELGLMDEKAMLEVMQEVYRLPMATPELLEMRDPRMPNLFPAQLAEKYQLVPVTTSGRTAVFVCASQVDPQVAKEIGFMLSLTLKTYLVCEARLQGLLQSWMGAEIEPRYVALVERLGKLDLGPVKQVGAPPETLAAHEALAVSVSPPVQLNVTKVEKVLDEIEAANRREQARREKARTGRISLDEATEACMRADDRDDIVNITLRLARQFISFVGLFVINNDFILGWDAVGDKDAREKIRKIRIPTSIASVLSMATRTRAHYLGTIPDSAGNNQLLKALGRPRPRNVLVVPILLQDHLIGLLYGDAGLNTIHGSRMVELLVFANRLSGAFEQLIRKKKNKALAAGPAPSVPRPTPKPAEPLEEASKTEEAEQAGAFPPLAPEAPAWSGRLEKGRPSLDESLFESDQILPDLGSTKRGLWPTAGQTPPEAPPPVEEPVRLENLPEIRPGTISLVDDQTEVVLADTQSGFAPRVGEEDSRQLSPVPRRGRPEPSEEPEPRPPTGEMDAVALAGELVSSNPTTMATACDKLVSIGPPAIPVIMKHFPGKLTFNVRGPYDALPPLREHSELLRCLITIGADAGQAVSERLENPDPNIRYYAVKMFGEIYCPWVVPKLVKRLYDRDPLIRLSTIDVLQTYRKTTEFKKMLSELRAKLRIPDPNQQAIAGALLGNFKDCDALPLLAGLVKSSQKTVSRAAVESLSYLTKQDFGTSERKWLKWWKSNKGKHRVQWLIDGLRSKNRDIRFSSSQEITQITEKHFGYYFDSNKEERDKAVQQWEQWWEETGRRMRFDD